VYPGYYYVFIGILLIVFGATKKNIENPKASFRKRKRKQILFICGGFLVLSGTVELIQSII